MPVLLPSLGNKLPTGTYGFLVKLTNALNSLEREVRGYQTLEQRLAGRTDAAARVLRDQIEGERQAAADVAAGLRSQLDEVTAGRVSDRETLEAAREGLERRVAALEARPAGGAPASLVARVAALESGTPPLASPFTGRTLLASFTFDLTDSRGRDRYAPSNAAADPGAPLWFSVELSSGRTYPRIDPTLTVPELTETTGRWYIEALAGDGTVVGTARLPFTVGATASIGFNYVSYFDNRQYRVVMRWTSQRRSGGFALQFPTQVGVGFIEVPSRTDFPVRRVNLYAEQNTQSGGVVRVPTEQGPQGPPGIQGPAGETGPRGPAGSGAVQVPSGTAFPTSPTFADRFRLTAAAAEPAGLRVLPAFWAGNNQYGFASPQADPHGQPGRLGDALLSRTLTRFAFVGWFGTATGASVRDRIYVGLLSGASRTPAPVSITVGTQTHALTAFNQEWRTAPITLNPFPPDTAVTVQINLDGGGVAWGAGSIPAGLYAFNGVAWVPTTLDDQGEVPAFTASNAGDVLKVAADGLGLDVAEDNERTDAEITSLADGRINSLAPGIADGRINSLAPGIADGRINSLIPSARRLPSPTNLLHAVADRFLVGANSARTGYTLWNPRGSLVSTRIFTSISSSSWTALGASVTALSGYREIGVQASEAETLGGRNLNVATPTYWFDRSVVGVSGVIRAGQNRPWASVATFTLPDSTLTAAFMFDAANAQSVGLQIIAVGSDLALSSGIRITVFGRW